MDRSWEIEQLAEHFSGAPSLFPSSPLYQSLCKVVVGDQPILKLLTQRQPGQQASFLLFGAIHYLLLSGVQHSLRDFYPSLAHALPKEPEEVGPVLLDFCHRYSDDLATLIRTRLVQTNVVKRSLGLVLGLEVSRLARNSSDWHQLLEICALTHTLIFPRIAQRV